MANRVETEFRLKNLEPYLKGIEQAKKATESLGKIPGQKDLTLKQQLDVQNKLIQQEILLERQKKATLHTEAERIKNANLLSKSSNDALRQSILQQRETKNSYQIERERLKVAKDYVDLLSRQVRLEQQQKRASAGGGSGNLGSVLGALPGGAILSGAVAGGVGGATAATLIETINLTQRLATSVVDLGVSAVKTGADFEKTVNAMKVFAGSTRLAKLELTELADLARQTPGLRIADAQSGATQLRGLGFSKEIAANLVVGLAKLKTIAGSAADEGAIQRATVNLTQLKAGSPQVGRDIQQIVLNLPYASQVITDSFGSLDKFKSAVQKNPDEALKKFSEALRDMQGVSGGLEGAFGKLQDEFLETGKIFSEPILEPLTKSVISLTDYIMKNRGVFREWGNYIGDTIEGYNNDPPPPPKEPTWVDKNFSTPPEIQDPIRRNFLHLISGGLWGRSISEELYYEPKEELERLRKAGAKSRLDRDRAEMIKDLNYQTGGNLTTDSYFTDVLIAQQSVAGKERKLTEEEQKAVDANAERDRIRAAERERQRKLSIIDSTYKDRFSIVDSNLKREEARISAGLNSTIADEKKQVAQLASVRSQNIQQQIKEQTDYFNTKLSLSETDSEKTELNAEKSVKLRDLETQGIVNQLESQRRLQELEKQIQEQRKQANRQITDAQTQLETLRTGDPFISIYAERNNAIRGFTENFKDATSQQIAEFTRLQNAIAATKTEIQKFENAIKAQGFRNQAFDLSGLLPSEIGGRGQRLGFLSDAINAAAGASNYRNQAWRGTQLANNLYFKEDTLGSQLNNFASLQDRLRTLAPQFGNLGIQGEAMLAQLRINALPSESELLERAKNDPYGQFGQRSRIALGIRAANYNVLAQAEEQKIKDSLFKNQFLTERTDFYSKQIAEAQRLVAGGGNVPLGARLDNALNAFQTLGVENLNQKQIQDYINTLELKAKDTERFNQTINKVMNKLDAIISPSGMKVSNAMVDLTVKGDDLTVDSNGLASPTAQDTADAMGLATRADSPWLGGFTKQRPFTRE